MFLIIISFLGGLVLLYLGAEGVVRGSVNIALRLGVSSLTIGLTIVAYGTSMPELIVSSKAALSGHGEIAIRNIVGSNIFNILCILGLSSLLMPIHGTGISKIDLYVMLGIAVLLLPFMWTGLVVKRWEGFFLFCLYIGYLYYLWPK